MKVSFDFGRLRADKIEFLEKGGQEVGASRYAGIALPLASFLHSHSFLTDLNSDIFDKKKGEGEDVRL